MSTEGLRIGVQSWTMRHLSFEKAVRATAAAGLHFIQFSSPHIDSKEPSGALLSKRRFLEAHGVVAYSFGVAEASTIESENRGLFEFARLLGLELVVVEPSDPRAFDSLERLAVEYGVDLAVHNHGPGTAYAEPARLMALLAGRDPRMGACLDSGWVTAAGYDAADVFRRYEGRVLDIHLKDLRLTAMGEITHVALGEGQVNLTGLIDAARLAGFGGVAAIESDADLADAGDFVRSAAVFVTRSVEARGNR
jgi:sugar phosphate isomerase/epimerase